LIDPDLVRLALLQARTIAPQIFKERRRNPAGHHADARLRLEFVIFGFLNAPAPGTEILTSNSPE